MIEKRKNLILSIAIVCFGLLLVGSTYAFLYYGTTTFNDKYSMGGTCFIIDYDAGGAITGTLFQSSTPMGGLSGSVSMNLSSNCEIESAIGTLGLNVDSSTSSILLSEGALKYAVYTNIDTNPVASGTITSTGNMTLYNNFPLTKTVITYYVYVWLDGNIADNDYVDLSFNGSIYATATQGETADGGSDTPDTRAAGLYGADGSFISWDTLVDNGDITVTGTELTAANLSLAGELIISDGITLIGDFAFADEESETGCSGLTSVVIPDSVTSIGDYAFGLCSGLTSVVIPDSVISIGEGAFLFCSGLTSIVIPDSVTTIGAVAFTGCSGLTNIVIPNNITSIGDFTFEECTGLTSIVIPDSVTSIGEGAFAYCSGLTSIVIPDSVTSIGDFTFEECTGLTSIVIPDSVTSIGYYAFSYCSSLTSVVIPDSVTSIRNYAFLECTSLTDVYYGGTSTMWSAVTIGTDNEYLTGATIHYNS